MKIKFKQDKELSYDGVNTKVYKAGQEYQASHSQEQHVFEHFLSKGDAEKVTEVNEKKVETKVVTPKSRKSK